VVEVLLVPIPTDLKFGIGDRGNQIGGALTEPPAKNL
jgi:hypothetical protein